MKIWIDMTNSPHVLFFRPIISELESRGHKVTITARDFAQTISLLDKQKIPYTKIGRHQGRNYFLKVRGLFARSFRLIAFARKKKFDLALSHNSNDIAVAAYLLRIPLVTMFDYEHAKSHHINLRLATKILVPDLIPNKPLYKYGAKDRKIDKYAGLKEEVYLADFIPDAGLLKTLGIDEKKILVTIRPPATMSHYHRIENPFFDRLLEHLGKKKDVAMVVLPRTKEQGEDILKKKISNLLIPKEAIDGPSLEFFSDIVISAGGTMNRESVALGTPVYTIFAPEMGAIDRNLIRQGKLKKLTDLKQLKLQKKKLRTLPKMRGPKPVVDKILETVK
jgi:predicted glycosyltransferase